MYEKIKQRIKQHLQKNFKIYTVLFVFYCVGILLGSITVNSLPTGKKDELADYLLGFLQLYEKQDVRAVDVFFTTFMGNVRMTFLLWMLGAAIVGIPFIYGLITVRGFIVGFTSGFIIWSAAGQGMLFSLVALLPAELLLLPCFMTLAANGIKFSWGIIKNKQAGESIQKGIKEHFLEYSLVTVGVIVCLALVSAIQAWIIPIAVRTVL